MAKMASLHAEAALEPQVIIGLNGFARSGKDTVADYLVANYGFVKLAFATPMREALYRLDPKITVADIPGVPLSTAVDGMGWENVKAESPDIRGLMQRIGTEVGRQMFGENIWVDLAMKEVAKHPRVVLSDCRFPNEAEAIKQAGGEIWRVEREGFGPVNGHSSEVALANFFADYVVPNNGTLNELHHEVDTALSPQFTRYLGAFNG